MQLSAYPEDMDRIREFETGSKPPYRKTFGFDGEFIDTYHQSLSTHPLRGAVIAHEIDGWLRPADALKLYEMAFFTQGDILELGTFAGLSSFVMAQAITASARVGHIESVELSTPRANMAKENLKRHHVNSVSVHISEGANWVREAAEDGRKFGFAFIDHAHTYEPMVAACSALAAVTSPGAFVAFHDFIDARNSNPSDDLKVLKAVQDSLPASFRFQGAFGCIGLYRYMP